MLSREQTNFSPQRAQDKDAGAAPKSIITMRLSRSSKQVDLLYAVGATSAADRLHVALAQKIRIHDPAFPGFGLGSHAFDVVHDLT